MKTISDTAKLKCNLGTLMPQLRVTSQTHDKVDGKLQATENDNQFPVNIPSFGTCSSLKSSCACKPLKWEKMSYSTIDGFNELNEKSSIKCGVGGTIIFTDAGKNTFVKSEISSSRSFSQPQELSSEEQEENKKPTYIIIDGKDYTYQEWKVFEEKLWDDFQKKNRK